MTAMTISVETHTLEHHLSTDESFASAYLRVIGAIASSNGLASLAEYSILNEIAESGDASAVASITVLTALEGQPSLTLLLAQLKNASKNVALDLRRLAFDKAHPLLKLQGYQSRNLAEKLAAALDYHPDQSRLSEFLDGSLWNKTLRLFKGTTNRNLAEMSLTLTRDNRISRCVADFDTGILTSDKFRDQIRAVLIATLADINQQIQSFEDQLKVIEFAANATSVNLDLAKALQAQVVQRMAAVVDRLNFERDTFDMDLESLIYDAGNAVTLEVTDRLKTDKWKDRRVWEGIRRTIYATELERRINIVVTRREEMLRLINEDLRVFKEELRSSRISILQQQHHNGLRHLVPTLRVRTRLINTVNTGATVILATGATAVAGAGAATFFLGLAVVTPVILPVMPFVAVPIAVAAVIKWISDSEGRKDGEIAHKREEFEKALREQLLLVRDEYRQQLSAVVANFEITATQMIQPIMLEAEAADQLIERQVNVAKRLIEHSRMTITKIIPLLATA
jgi:tellurite resistance protein